ncbi:hypothetical protein [Photobacterium angustum]|uniref:hypothetical protein n=1 Tax=Photobacterium angustum TaxID=661 RepID=UPI0005DBB223|nr:hypothetical protein [Photobacterium angustum]KJG02190.1 hypothetical protein UB35_08590 [Photobacterium angustum]PSV67027.1 hypothetical protein CTM95_10345 [Photobacterium angustum]
MTHSVTFTKPEQLHDITLRLEHLELRNTPEELFYSLFCYTKGYRKFLELVGSQVEPTITPVFQLDYVERGSIKLKNKIGYTPSLINWLGLTLAKLLSEDVTDENLNDKVNQLESDTAKFITQTCSNDGLAERPDPYIDPITFAEIMEDFSDGGKQLEPDEHVEVIDSTETEHVHNVIPFPRSFRSHVSISNLKKSTHQPFNGDDTFIAIKPCNVGTGAWWVLSVVTNRSFYVRIQDSEWLTKYQSGQLPAVVANDLITVNLVCDVVVNKTGGARNVNAYVTKVHNVKKSKVLIPDNQANLFE